MSTYEEEDDHFLHVMEGKGSMLVDENKYDDEYESTYLGIVKDTKLILVDFFFVDSFPYYFAPPCWK